MRDTESAVQGVSVSCMILKVGNGMNKHAVGYQPRNGMPPVSHPTREAGRINPGRMLRDKREGDK